MGDRTNPIKFGPEWLRNLSRERATTGTTGSAPPGMGGSRPSNTPTNSGPRVLLARLRYGREEMLALYDRQTAEAPALLKSNDTLYQPRGKPPYALNNSFDDDTRDSVNRQPPVPGLLPVTERYAGRGRGRDPSVNMENKNLASSLRGDLRGKARGYMRPNSAVRGWHSNRASGAYSGIPDDDPNQPLRAWNNNNNMNQSGLRPNNGEQPDWQSKQAQYRVKRQTSTNWRQQQGRDDGEEWRSAEGSRRPQDKWAEWGWQQESSGRPSQDKQWHSNRRTWVAGESNDDLPEWAVDNAEACGGTFDSSGAFHGYSNDDSNLPKNQENPYPLMKSHTHGSFARSKVAEEGSEEWWASEKAKKLSPKRFDAGDIKKTARPAETNQKKAINLNSTEEKSDPTPSTATESDTAKARYTGAIPKRVLQFMKDTTEAKSKAAQGTEKPEKDSPETEKAPDFSKTKEKIQTEEPTKDKPEKYEARFENEKQGEKGNIQSVIITSNNSLRQKHQNIAVTPTETPKRQANLMEYLEPNRDPIESNSGEFNTAKAADSDKIVEDILQMSLDDGIPSATINQLLTSHSNPAMNSLAQVAYPSMQTRMAGAGLQGLGLQNAPMTQTQDGYNGMMGQPMGITNSMLNASLGIPLPSSTTGVTLPLANAGLTNQSSLGLGMGMQQSGLQPGQVHMQGYGVQAPNIPSEMSPMPDNMQAGVAGQPVPPANNNLFAAPTIAMFPNDPEKSFSLARMRQMVYRMYGNNAPSQALPVNNPAMQQMLASDQWWYEDPNNTIQGPFSSIEMFHWFRAGFFSPTLMVRRSCDPVMRPLGSYGPMPFGPMDLLSAFPVAGGYNMQTQQTHDTANQQQQPGLGANVQSLWGQPANSAPTPDRMWMPNNNTRTNNPINSFSFNFWDNQTTEMPAAPLLPEMKTEDEILAQISFFADPPPAPPAPREPEAPAANANPNVNQLQKLTEKDGGPPAATPAATPVAEATEPEKVPKSPSKPEPSEAQAAKTTKPAEKPAETKPVKEAKNESKQKGKEATTKSKSKKAKEEKKEETVEAKPKEEEVKVEKRSAESSPTAKNKKEDKASKKDLDKEKKEWIKEGFTIVKGAVKASDKDSKKKAEDTKAAEEAERKKKEEEKEKLAAEEKKRQHEAIKKQQQESQAQQASAPSRQAAESVSKKAPWSASAQAQPPSREGLTLAEIQRLEREKKLEQMKEQQQMMQIIAQQQAAALAREQEMQAGLGWAKKPNSVTTGPTLAEIQAEARKQAAAAAASAAVAAPREEAQPTPPPSNPVPWATVPNGGDAYISAGFWDCPQAEPAKPAAKQSEPKAESKNKKKVTVMAPPKRENSPSVEFDMWCTNMLVSWRDTGIDVPTFVAFLRDIESPYEVKDYVKCYLGDTREANDFARQFVEKRSRLMRVGMVTPSDDLCSPAVAVNPRTNSTSDHADLKTKGKKTKKNKMLKVDARNILGFSVTASEDRINVGDIDTV